MRFGYDSLPVIDDGKGSYDNYNSPDVRKIEEGWNGEDDEDDIRPRTICLHQSLLVAIYWLVAFWPFLSESLTFLVLVAIVSGDGDGDGGSVRGKKGYVSNWMVMICCLIVLNVLILLHFTAVESPRSSQKNRSVEMAIKGLFQFIIAVGVFRAWRTIYGCPGFTELLLLLSNDQSAFLRACICISVCAGLILGIPLTIMRGNISARVRIIDRAAA